MSGLERYRGSKLAVMHHHYTVHYRLSLRLSAKIKKVVMLESDEYQY
jgi:hypothetical protein